MYYQVCSGRAGGTRTDAIPRDNHVVSAGRFGGCGDESAAPHILVRREALAALGLGGAALFAGSVFGQQAGAAPRGG